MTARTSGSVRSKAIDYGILETLDEDPVSIPVVIALRRFLHPHPHLRRGHLIVEGVVDLDVEIPGLGAFLEMTPEIFGVGTGSDLGKEVLADDLARVPAAEVSLGGVVAQDLTRVVYLYGPECEFVYLRIVHLCQLVRRVLGVELHQLFLVPAYLSFTNRGRRPLRRPPTSTTSLV